MRGKGLSEFHRWRIDELRLTPEQWRILIRFLEHNLNNGLSPLASIQFDLERGNAYPLRYASQIQAVLDRVRAVLDTLREVSRSSVIGHRSSE